MKSWGTGAQIGRVMASKAADPDAVAHLPNSSGVGQPRSNEGHSIIESADRRRSHPSSSTPPDARAAPGDRPDSGPDETRFRGTNSWREHIEYPGRDHAFWSGDVEALLGDIEEFITGIARLKR